MGKFKHRLTLPAIVFSLLLVVCLIIFGLNNLNKQTTLPPNSNQAAIGVTLNQDFDYIDLHKLQSSGISFIYLRSTQGGSYFDDNYLSYRDQVQGTQLAYGSLIDFSNESSAQAQYRYFKRKVGQRSGSLPILLDPVTKVNTASLKKMARLVRLLKADRKKVMVAVSNQYRKFFPLGTLFLYTGSQKPSSLQYAFWRYTNNGKVKNVNGLEKGVQMLSYNGTVAQYKEKYGQLTQ